MLRRISEDYIVNVLKNHDQLVLNCQIELVNIFKSKDEVGMNDKKRAGWKCTDQFFN